MQDLSRCNAFGRAAIFILGIGLYSGHCIAGKSSGPTVPTFFARRDYTGLDSNWLAVGDTNGDGIPDLIAGQQGIVKVLLGVGDGTFQAGPTSQTAIAGSIGIATDLNGDGIVDLVQSGDIHGNDAYLWGITVSLGNGDGTFQGGTFYQAGSDSYLGVPVVGDFNGDGIADVAVPGGSGVWLFTGKGGGQFNPGVMSVSISSLSGACAAGDFNGDGKLDLVVTLPFAGTNGKGNGFVVLFGNGDGTFQAPISFAQPQKPWTVAVGKLTKAGHSGIALSTSTDVYLYYGNGKGAFSGPRQVPLTSALYFALGDVDGDGIPDLVSSGGYVALGTASGTFKQPVYFPVEDSANLYNVVLADLRNNGRTDIVTDNYDGVSVLLNLGKGKFEEGPWTKVSGGGGCGAAADFNGDGRPDLAVNNAQGVSVLLGTGKASASFNAGSSIALANAGCLITGDLNGDGIPDLLVPVNGTVVAYLGTGDGTFTMASTTTTPSGGYVAVGDFNHDGKLDFATSGNLLAIGNGDGTFQTPVAIVSNAPAFSNIAVGDINNDGWPDLVLTNGGVLPTDYLYVLLNDQHGGFTQVPSNFGASTTQAILVDLNGDGFLDLVVCPIGGAAIYLGNGTGAFTFQGDLLDTVGLPGQNMVADVNGDGIPDIAVLAADTLEIYLGQGGATYATPFSVGTGPSPASVLVEDLHGQAAASGLPDIVAPDASGGVMTLINRTP